MPKDGKGLESVISEKIFPVEEQIQSYKSNVMLKMPLSTKLRDINTDINVKAQT